MTTEKVPRLPFEEYALDLAYMASQRGTCPRLRVGCVVTDSCDNRILATGYNGSSSGQDHCDDVGCLMQGGRCLRTIHAEMNAISHLVELDLNKRSLDFHVTHQPCIACLHNIFLFCPLVENIYWTNDYGEPLTESILNAIFPFDKQHVLPRGVHLVPKGKYPRVNYSRLHISRQKMLRHPDSPEAKYYIKSMH